MRIELLGPSGVGKSTLISVLIGQTESRAWIGPSEVSEQTADGARRPGLLREALDESVPRSWIDGALRLIAQSSMTPAQKVTAAVILRSACADHLLVAGLAPGATVVHDELLLHRAFSILPHTSPEALEEDARWYFAEVPLPDVAVVVSAPADTIVARIRGRAALLNGTLPNVYENTTDADLPQMVSRCLRICRAAADGLRRRGVTVFELDNSAGASAGAERLGRYLESATCNNRDDLVARLREVSRSFRQGTGRHAPRAQALAYASFRTRPLTVTREAAQRDTQRRIARLRLTTETVGGASVLDLGANVGAMLFELARMGICSGLGIEFDRDKVDLASDIARQAGLRGLRFVQGDVDELAAAEIGEFDIVLALAIEGHVQRPARLLQLLGQVTRRSLCFEGNQGCDVSAVEQRLRAAGFVKFDFLGLSDDDRDPRNNVRPVLLAHKPNAERWPAGLAKPT